MSRRTLHLLLGGFGVVVATVACSLPGSLVAPRGVPLPAATPTTPVTAPGATPSPQVIIVVATPTPGASPSRASAVDQPDAVEARRIAVYRQVAPAVVNITTQVLRSDFFWGTVPEEGSGSGFVWDTQGHIVTNNHVVQGADKIEVSFGGDTTLPAKIVGTDPVNDLAVIQVDSLPEGVQPLVSANSAGLNVGQTAIAIGNPFGQFERTMTVGIISALNRTIQTDTTVLRGVIQTDAAINRGNSGGPLLDSAGHLIGVTSAIFSPSGTSAGVGLAIPADKVLRVVPVLIEEGRFPHPWLGIESLGYELTPALTRALNLSVDRGLLIARLYKGSPADKAGLHGAQTETVVGNRRYLIGGDILTSVDGEPMSTWENLSAYLEEQAVVGRAVTLTVVRDGKTRALRANLEDTPDSLRGG